MGARLTGGVWCTLRTKLAFFVAVVAGVLAFPAVALAVLVYSGSNPLGPDGF